MFEYLLARLASKNGKTDIMEIQQVPGRKSDPKDSRRIQKIYSVGLLRESIVARGVLKELRMLIRERLKERKGSRVAVKAGAKKIAETFYDTITKGLDYVEQGTAKYIQQVKQKELKLMNNTG